MMKTFYSLQGTYGLGNLKKTFHSNCNNQVITVVWEGESFFELVDMPSFECV